LEARDLREGRVLASVLQQGGGSYAVVAKPHNRIAGDAPSATAWRFGSRKQPRLQQPIDGTGRDVQKYAGFGDSQMGILQHEKPEQSAIVASANTCSRPFIDGGVSVTMWRNGLTETSAE
jgi:hypothetical protein